MKTDVIVWIQMKQHELQNQHLQPTCGHLQLPAFGFACKIAICGTINCGTAEIPVTDQR